MGDKCKTANSCRGNDSLVTGCSGVWNKIMDAQQIRRSVMRVAHEILERNQGANKLAIVGIRTRGEYLAKRIVSAIEQIEGIKLAVGVVDITLYRDDIAGTGAGPVLKGTELSFDIDRHKIILVDDVLFTGRTIRAAIDAIIDYGRPKAVQLAVLCDRGHRELPIKADYVGKNITSERDEEVLVKLGELDPEDEGVYICKKRRA